MSIDARIEQNKADQQRLQEEGERLERERKDSEVTYSIGDRFVYSANGCCKGDKCLLVNVSGRVAMIALKSGGFFSYNENPKRQSHITTEEFRRISSGNFTRYWDARKQCKC
jgi:hypothetical protein